MEISGNNPLVGLNAGVQRLDVQQQTQRVQSTGTDSPQPDSDRLELSVRSREIQLLDGLIRSTPYIREAKVEELRSAVEKGTYNVKAEMIADKILGGNVIDEIF